MPTQQNVLDAQYEVDQKRTAIELKHRMGTKALRQNKLAMVATYDFAVNGGANGTINLVDCNGVPATLPKGAIITLCIIDTITALTGAGTVALGTGQTTSDLKAALAFGSYTGLVAGIPVGTAATSIKMTADATMSATIASGPITAGKLNILVEYYVSI